MSEPIATPEIQLAEAVDSARELIDLMRTSPGTRLSLQLGDLQLEVQTDGVEPARDDPAPGGQASGPSQPQGDRSRILAPLVGVFYRGPAPTEPPFVSVGDRVVAGQQVAIVEAMKLMNALVAESDGVVEEIHVEDGAVVEFEQLVMTVGTS